MISVFDKRRSDPGSRARAGRPVLRRLLVALVAVATGVAGVAALAGAAGAASTAAVTVREATTGAAPVVPVVAAENFWGDIARQIGGRDARVTSLITSPTADPHLFQTNAREAATLASAQVAIENGAGYDTWMSQLLGADGGSPHLVDVASVLRVRGSDPNPHLWYDLPRIPKVAAAIAAALSKAAPADRATFRANLAAFDASLTPLMTTLRTIEDRFGHAPVAYTERVPGYALAAAGLDVRTPPAFARAIEDGVDPSAADTLAMRQLLISHRVDVLLYNVQTVTPVTTQIRSLARQQGIPVVGVSETMPARARTYQQWQEAQLTSLLRALEAGRR